MIGKGLAGFAALCAVVWLGVWQWARLPSVTPLEPAERQLAMAVLRESLDGRPARAPALATPLDDAVVVQLWHHGRSALRLGIRGAPGGVWRAEAGRRLAAPRATLDEEVRAHGRLKVDLIRARAPMPTTLMERWPLFSPSRRCRASTACRSRSPDKRRC